MRRRRSSACSAACAAALVLALSAPAHAEDEPPLELDVTSVGPREQAEPTELHAWGLAALVGAGIDRGAFAGRVAGRYRLSNSWEVGLDLELNPWFSIEAGEVVPGAVSGFATVLHHWASAGRITIHTALHVGVSVLLFDLHAADSGAVGPFLGGTLLGVSIRLGRGWALLIEPAEVMLPVPQLGGVPFYYRQYRFTVGIQWNP